MSTTTTNRRRHIIVVVIVVCVAASALADRTLSSEKRKIAQMNGDLILGGLFPMHEHNASRMEQPCGAIKEEKGIQVI